MKRETYTAVLAVLEKTVQLSPGSIAVVFSQNLLFCRVDHMAVVVVKLPGFLLGLVVFIAKRYEISHRNIWDLFDVRFRVWSRRSDARASI